MFGNFECCTLRSSTGALLIQYMLSDRLRPDREHTGRTKYILSFCLGGCSTTARSTGRCTSFSLLSFLLSPSFRSLCISSARIPRSPAVLWSLAGALRFTINLLFYLSLPGYFAIFGCRFALLGPAQCPSWCRRELAVDFSSSKRVRLNGALLEVKPVH